MKVIDHTSRGEPKRIIIIRGFVWGLVVGCMQEGSSFRVVCFVLFRRSYSPSTKIVTVVLAIICRGIKSTIDIQMFATIQIFFITQPLDTINVLKFFVAHATI